MLNRPTVISIFNQKGGVGKTTTAVNLGAGLARLGHRVCFLDNDPQNNLTSHLIESSLLCDPKILTMEDVYRGESRQRKLLSTRLKMDCIPSTQKLRGMDWVLEGQIEKEKVLKKEIQKLSQLSHYAENDFLLIDNPPNLHNLSLNALAASDFVFIPVQLEFFSLEGLGRMGEAIEEVRKTVNSQLKLLGILPSMVSSRRRMNDEVCQAIQESFPSQLFTTQIPLSVVSPEASGYGKTIFEYAPKSKLATAFERLSSEVIDEIQKKKDKETRSQSAQT